MTPSTLAALLADTSSAVTIVATTFTLAAVTLRKMSSGAMLAALARPAMKLALSKLSTVPAVVNCSTTTVCFISPLVKVRVRLRLRLRRRLRLRLRLRLGLRLRLRFRLRLRLRVRLSA
jgi:hypothetical protein